MSRNVETFRQGDPRWGRLELGGSGLTMAGYGCYTTFIATALRSLFQKDVDPGALAVALSNSAGYDRHGQVIWGAVTRLFGNVRLHGRAFTTNVPTHRGMAGVLTPEKAIADIRAANLKGQGVGICVDLVEDNWAKPDHIVMAMETPEDLSKWTVADPAFGREMPFSERYGSPLEGVMGYRILVGTPTEFPGESTMADIQAGKAVGLAVDERYTKLDMLEALMSV